MRQGFHDQQEDLGLKAAATLLTVNVQAAYKHSSMAIAVECLSVAIVTCDASHIPLGLMMV